MRYGVTSGASSLSNFLVVGKMAGLLISIALSEHVLNFLVEKELLFGLGKHLLILLNDQELHLSL